MGQILHGSAATILAVRTAIQRSKAPLKELAARARAEPEDRCQVAQSGLLYSPVLDLFPTLWRLLGDVRCLTTGGHGGRRPGRRKLTHNRHSALGSHGQRGSAH